MLNRKILELSEGDGRTECGNAAYARRFSHNARQRAPI